MYVDLYGTVEKTEELKRKYLKSTSIEYVGMEIIRKREERRERRDIRVI